MSCVATAGSSNRTSKHHRAGNPLLVMDLSISAAIFPSFSIPFLAVNSLMKDPEPRLGSGFRGQDIEIEMPVFLEETIADASKPVEYELPTLEQGQTRHTRKSLNVTIPAGCSRWPTYPAKRAGRARAG